ncbi:MAG: hypothetical protein IPL27_27890 [Lewinellaceae bacterium]|nr:hypothetical protein [Lewinellaceae bacterium]
MLKYPGAALPKLRIAFCQIRQNRPDEAITGCSNWTNMADLPANLLPMVHAAWRWPIPRKTTRRPSSG